jgi:hypothetical protein
MVVLVEGEGIARVVALSRSSRMGVEEDVRMISGAEIRDGGTLVPPPPPPKAPSHLQNSPHLMSSSLHILLICSMARSRGRCSSKGNTKVRAIASNSMSQDCSLFLLLVPDPETYQQGRGQKKRRLRNLQDKPKFWIRQR